MKPTYTLSIVLLLFVVAASVFGSCQRNGGVKTTDNTDVQEPAPVVDIEEVDTTLLVVDDSIIHPEKDTSEVPLPDPSTLTKYSWILLYNEDGTLGYEVMKSGNLVVTQPTIPGEGGTTGFANREQAAAAAELVISKLEQGILPPTISDKELKKILKN